MRLRARLAVLDTNVWVRLVAGRLHRKVLTRAVGRARFLIPTTVLSEISSLAARGVVSRKTVERVRRAGEVLAIDADTAVEAGAIHGNFWRKGMTRVSLADATILAVAHRHGATLVTFDEDFAKQEGVHILPPDAT